MPITDALHTAAALEQAGLPKPAAVLIAEKLEETALATQESSVERFRAELAEFRAEVRTELASQRAEFERSFRTLQTTILSALALLTTVVLAVGGAIITILLRH